MVWRFELGQSNYSIRHRPGKDNVAPDAMSRIFSSMSSVSQLRLLHDQLGHPGFARMYHCIRSRNLPYTSEEKKTFSKNAGLVCDSNRDFLTPHRNVLLRWLGRGNVCRSTSRGLSVVRNLIFSSLWMNTVDTPLFFPALQRHPRRSWIPLTTCFAYVWLSILFA